MDIGDNTSSNLPQVGTISQLPHNKLRLGYGSQILGKVIINARATTGAGLRDIADITQVKIPISSPSPNAFLNPGESVLRCKFKITTSAGAGLAHNAEKYIFRGASTFIRSMKVSHLTKGGTIEKVDNMDMLVQLCKSLLPASYFESLCWDVDGSSVNSYVVDTKANLDADAVKKAINENNKYLADDSPNWATGGLQKHYNADEVNQTMNRTMNKEVEVEIPIPSGVLSSSNSNLIPLFHCPLLLELDLNNITTIFKQTVADTVTKVECEFKYFMSCYQMSDEVSKQVAVLNASEGIVFDYDRLENIQARIPSGASSYAQTFNFQQVSSVVSAISVLTPDASLNAFNKDRYVFRDGSKHGQDANTGTYVNSLQYGVSSELFPRERLECKPYNYSILHTLAKSSVLSDGTKFVYITDSNHESQYLGEDEKGNWRGGLADKFHLSMAFSNLNKDAYKSGLSLVNSPLSIDLNFQNALTENLVLNVWLLHQAEMKVTASDFVVKR